MCTMVEFNASDRTPRSSLYLELAPVEINSRQVNMGLTRTGVSLSPPCNT